MKQLAGLKILVTRPAHQAQELCAAIKAAGGKAISFPTLAIKPLQNEDLFITLRQLVNVDLVIFTSANAVWNTLPSWPTTAPKLLLAAIGPATAKALLQFKMSADLQAPVPFNSEALLSLPALQQVKNLRIVIFGGEGGRDLLEKTLAARGAQVKKIATYQRCKPETSSNSWSDQAIDIIITTSKESLENLYGLTGDSHQTQLLTTPLLVVSKRLQAAAESLGFGQIILAENPTDKAILATLKAWYAKRQP